MSDEAPPSTIGQTQYTLHIEAEEQAQLPPAHRIAKGSFVGLMFSVIPILLTNYILTRGEGRIDPISFSAAIPVMYVSINLLRPRDRWYALGSLGFAMGERYFGSLRWDARRFQDIERADVEVRRVTLPGGEYDFTGFRYRFFGPKKSRMDVEGEVKEAPPRGTEIHLPPDDELPPKHVLRFVRQARKQWEQATGKKAEVKRL